ncbi:1,4-alpha-glucan branching protein domain-containing protein [Paenibacillus eucommiae]|uniref:1,4-alpha-glucan branching enzyme n=1 Tax=Paenibacillus eucommiae TaxID=1355755 RepID=A0ABS4J455_9BACL|nr:1,4-alpha-glucan branching protein domain-containing protein [Paenibacillus eucommiae]MBP1993584.1 1,4-alpha-glucan branching enzyme [Paenibacillus eucommiae]
MSQITKHSMSQHMHANPKETSPTAGYVALLLHAHLPYVRQEKESVTLEERWFYEAVTDTYLPLIELLDKLLSEGVCFHITLSLSPTLLAMLDDPLMKQKTRAHLHSLCELADKEVQRLGADAALADTARMYASRYSGLSALFDRLDGDLIAKLRSLRQSGCVELITCAATHAFLPLVKNASALRAQLEAAVTEFRRHFGAAPAGIWLPECGYTPAVEPHLQALGLRYFVVDAHAVGWTAKAHGSRPRLTPGGSCAFARDPEASTQVWSAEAGYPGDADYREYYRDIGFDLGRAGGAEWDYIKPYVLPDGVRIHTGLKYYRVTGDGDAKQPYQPEAAARKAQQHAEHFLAARLEQLKRLEQPEQPETSFKTAELQTELQSESESDSAPLVSQPAPSEAPPIIVCPYDAELFGHWWFEGLLWLEAVLRGLDTHHSELKSISLAAYNELYPPVDTIELPVSSWGRGGFAEVWLQPKNDWVYPLLHAAEDRLIQAVHMYPEPNQLNEQHELYELQKKMLNQAAKELMLAQSSDWTFILDAGTVTEYAVQRIQVHLQQFHNLLDQLQDRTEEQISFNSAFLKELEKAAPLLPELSYKLYCDPLFPKEASLVDNTMILETGKLHKIDNIHQIRKLRILMLTWEYPPRIIGGLARAVCDLSRQLAAAGHDVHVITCQTHSSPLYEIAERVHVHRVQVLQSLEAVNFLDWVFLMNSAFSDAILELTEQGFIFDLLHGHDWLIYYCAKESKRTLKLPLVITIHATEYGRHQGKLKNELQHTIHSIESKLVLMADCVIVCSRAMVQEVHSLFQLSENNIIRIPNGLPLYPGQEHQNYGTTVPLLQALKKSGQEQIVCFLGRLVHEKGVHILLEAMHHIIHKLPDIKLLIAGSGPSLEWLQELAAPLREHVQFVGFLDEADKYSLLQLADVCVFPSLYEPFGIVALEAMATGTPVIASDVGGLSEIIEHGVDGCKVPPDDAAALASQVLQLLLDPEFARTLATAASYKARTEFNGAQLAEAMIQTYFSILQNEQEKP